jgi:diguanylate cyclase (GGDEF)-like protein/PAS domain S-box-containing protein
MLPMLSFDDPEIYRSVLDNLTAGVYLVDRTGKIVFWNAGAERITGYLRQDVVGHSSLQDFLGHLDGQNNAISKEALPVANVLREGKASDAQVSLKHKSGHRLLVRLHAAPIRDIHGALIGAMENFEEVVSTAGFAERQNKLAAYGCLDEASGVLNHGMVQSHLRETLATFSDHRVPFSIMCIGIDRLDAIKSRSGGGAVPAMIRAVGQTLENSLRPTDFLGRWMENEFLAVLPECSADEVGSVGERLRRMVNQCGVEWWGEMLQVTVSMGATSAKTADTAEAMLRRAENGLQQSLKQGGNRLVLRGE